MNGLNDSVEYSNVMKFHEAGKFWRDGLGVIGISHHRQQSLKGTV